MDSRGVGEPDRREDDQQPQPDPGSRVEIRIFEDDLQIATVETTAS